MIQDDDMKSLNSQAQLSESKRSKKSKNDPEKLEKEAIDNKKKLKVIKEAHKDLKSKYTVVNEQYLQLKTKHAEQDQKVKEYLESNDELKAENAKLYDNILMLQQKITDELGAQMEKNNNPFTSDADQGEPKKSNSLKDVSLIADIKKTQGQGGGKIKKSLAMAANMNEDELKLFEEQEEDELREQMEASNKIAMALVQQENESKLLEDSLKSKEDELNSLNEELAKSKTDFIAKEKEMNHFKQLYEDSYE